MPLYGHGLFALLLRAIFNLSARVARFKAHFMDKPDHTAGRTKRSGRAGDDHDHGHEAAAAKAVHKNRPSPAAAEGAERDWSKTLFLPKTGFGMKAGLPNLEPKLLQRWSEMNLYKLLRKAAKAREKFVLHDGPPYANGNIHIGTGLNKILKDAVVRSQQMMGKDANYVPGWDCHGLPIEWKVEEQYRAKNKNKEDVPVNEFRRECREFAQKWIGVQMAEFRRLGVEGDWQNHYATMAYRGRGRHRERADEVRHERLALSRLEARDVVGGGAHRAGRGRGRISGARQPRDLGEVPRVSLWSQLQSQSSPTYSGDRIDRHLDHNAMDHPRQPGDRVLEQDRIRPLRGNRGACG